MRATTIHAPGDIRFEEVPDPVIEEPTDAIIKVVAGCICGSDLWPYRGHNDITAGSTIGHECVGVVEEVGREVRDVKVGDFVVVPFDHCDNTCAHCRAGMQSACVNVDGTARQCGQVLSQWQKGTTTKSPAENCDTSLPTSTTSSPRCWRSPT